MRTEDLEPIVAELVTKPRHEKVRAHLLRLLTDGLGADATSVDFERPLPEVRGRVDALLGRTVFEIKSDLVRERSDAERQLSSYLPQRERETGQRFVGIATDGAEFRVYMFRDGRLDELGQFKPKINEPRGLLGWLESVVALTDEILPDVIGIQRELGRHSIAYHRAIREIEALWNDLKDNPEANLKRDLWNRLLRVAYGANIEAPALFFQHTYLTIVAKAIATVALLDTLPASGTALLEGEDFRDHGIVGAVESDFFDWVLLHPKGGDLVIEIARQANRFRLRDVQVDILKGLYESLIDPEQRHDLGEYYTPDWLADRICKAAIRDPLKERVIDPACGSGTFLFHAIRRLLAAAHTAGLSAADAILRAGEKVAGIDVHPVAVIFARATYLLALMPTLQQGRPGSLSVPVYLGDSLQWNAREFMNLQDLEVIVPVQGEADRAEGGTISIDDRGTRVILRFPLRLAGQRALFDEALDEMISLAEHDQPATALAGWLARKEIKSPSDVRMLLETYEALRTLRKEGRDHLWGYVARNLSRPVWLASDAQKADVVIGNPPWLRYSTMSATTKQKFQEEMVKSGLWIGGKSATAQDLSSYFFARSVYLYMREDGRIAFVMPYAAMTRDPYQLFRKGSFKVHGYTESQVRFTDAWAFPSDVQPLFPVPSCVLFAERSRLPKPLPNRALFFSGFLPRRDAHSEEADTHLASRFEPWPTDDGATRGSPYREKFRNGATLWPRRLVIVERVQVGRLGENPTAPILRGRTSNQDKRPWKDMEPLEGAVEAEFLRPVYLGESIAPFRLLNPALGVIPWDAKSGSLLDASGARARGISRLGRWLEQAEALWNLHSAKTMLLRDRWDYNHALSVQLGGRSSRVLYTKAGSQPAAAILDDPNAVVENGLYWMSSSDRNEARYLISVFNSETTRSRVERYQAQGQWGARHFDKVMFNLPIARFDPKLKLHRDLAVASERAERVAAAVLLREGEHFTRARRRIRDALRADGVADEIDGLVERLLVSKPQRVAA